MNDTTCRWCQDAGCLVCGQPIQNPASARTPVFDLAAEVYDLAAGVYQQASDKGTADNLPRSVAQNLVTTQNLLRAVLNELSEAWMEVA